MALHDVTTVSDANPLRVVHFVDSAGSTDRLWGKENVIVSLMEAQRDSGRLSPELITFTTGLLDRKMQAAGFRVNSLGATHRRIPARALGAVKELLNDGPPAILHTHEYKANIVGRLARLAGARIRKLVSTCHGWVDHTPQLDFYYTLDRYSALLSNVVTVTDPAMLAQFPPFRPRRTVFVQNAVPDRPVPKIAERLAARSKFGFAPNATVVGSLGRLTKNKGLLDILEVAKRTTDAKIMFAIAGSGVLADEIANCGLTNVRFVGYQESTEYLAALDVYLQASYFEGLSLSLLEAMRCALPSVSTKAGATEFAIRNLYEALLVDAGDLDAIVAAIKRLQSDDNLRAELGSAARARFDACFAIKQQYEAFLALYLI